MHSDPQKPFIFKWGPLFAGMGFLISGYLTFHHYAIRIDPDRESFCNVSKEINCDVVALHPSSKVLGIPLGVYGMAFFAVIAFLAFKVSRSYPDFALAYIRFSTLIGFVVTIMLFYQSKVRIGAICIMCVAVYVANFVLLLMTKPFSLRNIKADFVQVYQDLQVRQ